MSELFTPSDLTPRGEADPAGEAAKRFELARYAQEETKLFFLDTGLAATNILIGVSYLTYAINTRDYSYVLPILALMATTAVIAAGGMIQHMTNTQATGLDDTQIGATLEQSAKAMGASSAKKIIDP